LPFEIGEDGKVNLSHLRTAFLKTLEEEGVKEGTILIPKLSNSEDPHSRIAIVLASIKNARDIIVYNNAYKQRVSKLLKEDHPPVLSQVFELLYNSGVPKKLQENLQFLVKKYPRLTLQLYNLLAGSALFSAPRVSVDSIDGYKIYANTIKNRQTDAINLTMVDLRVNDEQNKTTLCLSGAGGFNNLRKLQSFQEKLLKKYQELQEDTGNES